MPQDLHRLARQGDLPGAQAFLNSVARDSFDIDAYDRGGRTSLMDAATSSLASAAMLTLLVDRGANVHPKSRAPYDVGRGTLALAISGGDHRKKSRRMRIFFVLDTRALVWRREASLTCV